MTNKLEGVFEMSVVTPDLPVPLYETPQPPGEAKKNFTRRPYKRGEALAKRGGGKSPPPRGT